MVVCDSPAGYVTRISPSKAVSLPEEVDSITNQLLSIFKTVYQTKMMMKESNRLVRREVTDLEEGEVKKVSLLPCFHIEDNKRKRRRRGDEELGEA